MTPSSGESDVPEPDDAPVEDAAAPAPTKAPRPRATTPRTPRTPRTTSRPTTKSSAAKPAAEPDAAAATDAADAPAAKKPAAKKPAARTGAARTTTPRAGTARSTATRTASAGDAATTKASTAAGKAAPRTTAAGKAAPRTTAAARAKSASGTAPRAKTTTPRTTAAAKKAAASATEPVAVPAAPVDIVIPPKPPLPPRPEAPTSPAVPAGDGSDVATSEHAPVEAVLPVDEPVVDDAPVPDAEIIVVEEAVVVEEPVVEEPVVEEPVVEDVPVEAPSSDAVPTDGDPVAEIAVVVAEPDVADRLFAEVPTEDAESKPALEVTGLRKTYGSTVAVAGIDLTVPAGAFYGLVGPNGAGKTTTLSMIAGLLRPTTGSIRVAGVDALARGSRAKRLIGVLPDRLRTFDRLTGRQLLSYAGLLRGLDSSTVEHRVSDLGRAFDLTSALGRSVSDYSAGMTKKVMLAAAMIHSPRLLVLDEPFEAVDPVSSGVILDILGTYVGHGGSVLLSSHGMDLVERVCDRVAVIVAGQVLADGTVDEVRGQQSLEARFLELTGGANEVEGLEWLHTFSG